MPVSIRVAKPKTTPQAIDIKESTYGDGAIEFQGMARRMVAKRLTLFFEPISRVILVDSGAVRPRACSVVITRIWREP